MTQTLFLSRFFFACILCLYVVLFPRHTDTHRLHGRVVRAWKLNSRSLNKRRTARASPHPGKRNKKTGLSSDRAEMHRWEYCRVKVFIIFFFPVQRRNKRVSFHSFRWRPVRHSKVRAVGQVLNILFFFLLLIYVKTFNSAKPTGVFGLFLSSRPTPTFSFPRRAIYLFYLSIILSPFEIFNTTRCTSIKTFIVVFFLSLCQTF